MLDVTDTPVYTAKSLRELADTLWEEVSVSVGRVPVSSSLLPVSLQMSQLLTYIGVPHLADRR